MVRKRGKVLLLNGDWRPWKLITWRKAVQMVVLDKVRIVEEYDDWTVRSPSTEMNVPAVVVLRDYVEHRYKLTECRENVLARDGYTCQYCGRTAGQEGLSKRRMEIDHVVPESRGGDTTWLNLVACCPECNRHKGDRTPDEADMQLLNEPFEPGMQNPLKFWIRESNTHESWSDYCAWLDG